MFELDDNYYLRKCYFKRNQVPTQSVMRNKMTKLADVYFKDMARKLKILAGLQPIMKGGGSDWYQPPKDLLDGIVNLKPIKKEYLSKLRYNGIGDLGEHLVQVNLRRLMEEKDMLLERNDRMWKENIITACERQWHLSSIEESEINTAKIKEAFTQFEALYSTSITKIESHLFAATVKAIERIREDAYDNMTIRYKCLLLQQRNSLYRKYCNMLKTETENLKSKFVANILQDRKETWEKIHDLNVEKHKAIEKLRHLLECQNLACQMYVTMKEKEACNKEITEIKDVHKKKIANLTEDIAYTDLEIQIIKEKKRTRQQFSKVWELKVCHVVKRFQTFVKYCLNLLPEYADFFINMEKLMLLQLSEAMSNPSCESSIVEDEEAIAPTEEKKVRPFSVYTDLHERNEGLILPRHTSAELPVLVINKRFIYAACNNVAHFAHTLGNFIENNKLDLTDMQDQFNYSYSLPVKYTASQQILELNLESSIMQILQMEYANVQKISTSCCICGLPHCFCSPIKQSYTSRKSSCVSIPNYTQPPRRLSEGRKIVTRAEELHHEREPKMESYAEYVKPIRCKCAKRAKKQLENHLPPYMLQTSPFDPPEIPNYETCTLTSLKRLIGKYRAPPPQPVVIKVESKTRDVGTQYEDEEYDLLCTCYSDEEIEKLLRRIKNSKICSEELFKGKFQVVGDKTSLSNVDQSDSRFAMRRAFELKKLVESTNDLQEIFKRTDCSDY